MRNALNVIQVKRVLSSYKRLMNTYDMKRKFGIMKVTEENKVIKMNVSLIYCVIELNKRL